MNRCVTVAAECFVIFAKAVLISAVLLMMADYFGLPFFAVAGGAYQTMASIGLQYLIVLFFAALTLGVILRSRGSD